MNPSLPNPQDLAQWIDEIRALKQQVADLKRDRDRANEEADRWRERYTTEAQQRRVEAREAQRAAQQSQRDIEQLQSSLSVALEGATAREARTTAADGGAVQPDSRDPETYEAALGECRRLRERLLELTQILDDERDRHERTRHSLTAALGDTMDVLKLERAKLASLGERAAGADAVRPAEVLPDAALAPAARSLPEADRG